MALSQSDLTDLLDAIRAGGDLDVVRRSVELVLQREASHGDRPRPSARSSATFAIERGGVSEETMMLSSALDGLLDANVAQVTVRQNVIIQKVSAWAAIAAVPTIITGVYGMNFRHFPELQSPLGYPFAIVLMILSALALRWNFRRLGWL